MTSTLLSTLLPPSRRGLALIAGLVATSTAVVALLDVSGTTRRPDAPQAAIAHATPAGEGTQAWVDAHPEWVLPYAASVGSYAPAGTAAAEHASTAVPVREALPSWLTGQADRSPAAVLETWRSYARTQGPTLDAMLELVAYARQHPARATLPDGHSVDAWLQAVASDPAALKQMVTAGYLDARMSALFEASDARLIADAVRDLDWASGCAGEACGSWRARYAEAVQQESAEGSRAGTPCGVARLARIGGWLVGQEVDAARDVARAMDSYLSRRGTVACAPMG